MQGSRAQPGQSASSCGYGERELFEELYLERGGRGLALFLGFCNYYVNSPCNFLFFFGVLLSEASIFCTTNTIFYTTLLHSFFLFLHDSPIK